LDKLAQRIVNKNTWLARIRAELAPFTVLRKTRVINPVFQGLSSTKAEVGTHGE